MLEKIISLDKQLFLFLNNLGSEPYDWFWFYITKQSNWWPIFLVFLYLVYTKLGWKKTGLVLLIVTLILVFTDQTCNLFKNSFERLRPCNNPEFQGIMRNLKPSLTYSFFSGHAANSSAVATFLFLLLRKFYKPIGFIIIWPLIFAYSRIYLGLHYPIDIISGYICGILFGILFFKIFQFLEKRFFQ